MANIRKRGNNYQFTVSMGFGSEGKRVTRTKTWIPPLGLSSKQEEKQAKLEAELFERECQNNVTVDSNMKFRELIELWKTEHCSKLRPKTRSRYIQMLPRILTALGEIRLSKLTKQHILQFYKNLMEPEVRENVKYTATVDIPALLIKKKIKRQVFAGMCCLGENTVRSAMNGQNVARKSAEKIALALKMKLADCFEPVNVRPLSARTCNHYHRTISAILSFAVDMDYITASPCDRIKTLPWKLERSEAKFLDIEESKQLIQAAQNQDDYQFEVAIKLLLHTGLRRGELCGLQWIDINFDERTLSVERSLLNNPYDGVYIDTTKNYSSQRVIFISNSIAEMMQDFKCWQENLAKKLGSYWVDSGYIFTGENGDRIHPNTFSAKFRSFIKKNNLPNACLHSLRHSSASIQISAGVPITTVAKRLGHSTSATTTRIYAHSLKSSDEKVAEILDELLDTKKKDDED